MRLRCRIGLFTLGFGVALIVEKIAIWGKLYTPRYPGDLLDHGFIGLIIVVSALIILLDKKYGREA